ncbi:MAG: hypothetical protein K2X28_07375 [Alphaproteobacteria bacterium]|nr:hypothetical protein [Alphaproteobacteria bacterium]
MPTDLPNWDLNLELDSELNLGLYNGHFQILLSEGSSKEAHELSQVIEQGSLYWTNHRISNLYIYILINKLTIRGNIGFLNVVA